MAEEKVEKVEATPVSNEELKRKALIAFILSAVGFTFDWIPFASIASIVLGVVALNLRKASLNVTENPYRVFNKITLPLSIVNIVGGAIMFVVYLVTLIIIPAIAIATGA